MTEKQILLVDDDPVILAVFEQSFVQKGYKAFSVADGKAALEILDREKIFVIFLDLNMPGMDGVETCRRILQKQPISIIYAVTGYASLFELSTCLEAGFADYFIKPVNVNLLYKAAADAFEKIERWRSKNN